MKLGYNFNFFFLLDILPALPLPSRAFHGPLSASASGSAATPGSSNPVPGPSSTTARGSGMGGVDVRNAFKLEFSELHIFSVQWFKLYL